MYNNLKEIIQELIERGFEGNYWDFKQKWHKNNDRLLHDILCFVNTVHVKDCFLIFGVSDSCEVIGVTDDENRKKQADVLDLLNNCSFAGDNKPKISLETINLHSKELDVLIIHNTNNTPLYITKKCKKI
ncbi:ATP-binding protein [Clostridium novyi]|uniref:ATP-binding protein n=1 Tax=Clostridium novyi TaxID=1542 RepID=UPI000ACA6032|nr:ATP-binding protein [Clostridium novyi]